MERTVKITTLRTTDTWCPDNRSCPSIHAIADEPHRRYLVTKKVTNPEVAAAFAHLVNQPGDHLFRIEVLPAYEVGSDGEDYRRWLQGATEPTWSRKQPWLDTLRRERDNEQTSTRIRILSEQVSDYERYACGFGYRYNSEYEDIRVLRRGEHQIPPGLIERDFWIIGDLIVVSMCYDDRGRLEGAQVADSGELADHLRTRDLAWAAAEPFADWWARHPELYHKQAA